MTLAEFERLCESGPLDSIRPEDVIQAANRVYTLAEKFEGRLTAQAGLWKPKPRERRAPARMARAAKPAGIEKGLPTGDREAA